MRGFQSFPYTRSFKPDTFIGSGQFKPTLSSSPTTSVNKGTLKNKFSTVYAATGIYTLTFNSGIVFPETPIFVFQSQCADITNTNRFEVTVITPWSNTTRAIVIQTSQAGTALDVPTDPENLVNFIVLAINNTGK